MRPEISHRWYYSNEPRFETRFGCHVRRPNSRQMGKNLLGISHFRFLVHRITRKGRPIPKLVQQRKTQRFLDDRVFQPARFPHSYASSNFSETQV